MPPKRTQGASGSCAGQTEPDDHAIGRSRGGLTTKIQLACDGHGRPLPVLWTGGQAGDTTRFADLPAGIRFPRRPGPGRPATRPDRVLADRAYSSRAIRAYLRGRGIGVVIPERRDQQDHRRNRGRTGGRRPRGLQTPGPPARHGRGYARWAGKSQQLAITGFDEWQ
ncbi:transposase [Kibdelosporangium phytohabitans]|uniref:transposase n=1 Tax=Kibdelosporangium phytohabitans TaxID=860235 RepID=UPI003AAFA1BD